MKRTQQILQNEVTKHGRGVLNKVAYESQISISTIEQLFRGTYKHCLTFNKAVNLARALNVPITDLVDDDNQAA